MRNILSDWWLGAVWCLAPVIILLAAKAHYGISCALLVLQITIAVWGILDMRARQDD